MTITRAVALLLLAALAGCGGMAGGPPGGAAAGSRQPTAIAVSTEQGGRFIGLTGPRLQHTTSIVPRRMGLKRLLTDLKGSADRPGATPESAPKLRSSQEVPW
jgi:hypothetical protein